jgi:signal transduction histidine kinase
MSKPRPPTALHAWPVFVALALLALLIAGRVGAGLILSRHIMLQVDVLVEDTQQSLVLLDDLRSKAQNLSEPGIAPADHAALVAAIERDARDYTPIAISPGEADEWRRLQAQLGALGSTPLAEQATREHLADEIDISVDRLVMINARQGRMQASTIRDLHAHALRREEVIGGITLVLVVLVSWVLLRILARQRRLVAERYQLLDEHARDLEAFAGRAAHDLRSPMNPIRGYADLLLESADSPADVAGMARRIRTAVDRMARIVDDMLALSIAGRPSPGIASPQQIAAAAIEDMRPELQGTTVDTSFTGGKVACSSAILHQMLRQLIGNALKFRDRTRPLHVTIQTRDAGRMVELVVEDNGLGMDPETAKHALEPVHLQRMDREVPGHGLGLAIVDRATRSLGGTCELSSALDRGTRVTLRLPRA